MKKILALSLVALAACSDRAPQQIDSALAADIALTSQMQAARPLAELNDGQPQAAPERDPAPKPQQAQPPRRVVTRVDNAPRVRVMPRQPVVAQAAVPTPQPQPQPEAPTPAPAPARASIGAGASFSLASQQRICTSNNRPGDRFVATVTNTISGSNGATIPAGTNVVLQVASVNENGIAFSVHSVELNDRNYPVTGDVYSTGDLERIRLDNGDARKVAGGAAVGAILGHIMGKSTKATVIGAAAGGATGAVAAKMSEKYDNCLPVGAPMRLTLSNALLL
jgi:hypothetical protein